MEIYRGIKTRWAGSAPVIIGGGEFVNKAINFIGKS